MGVNRFGHGLTRRHTLSWLPRDRTCPGPPALGRWNQRIEFWLLGQDSNLEPSGYKRPGISSGLGLSLHPLQQTEGRVSGASPESYSRYEQTL